MEADTLNLLLACCCTFRHNTCVHDVMTVMVPGNSLLLGQERKQSEFLSFVLFFVSSLSGDMLLGCPSLLAFLENTLINICTDSKVRSRWPGKHIYSLCIVVQQKLIGSADIELQVIAPALEPSLCMLYESGETCKLQLARLVNGNIQLWGSNYLYFFSSGIFIFDVILYDLA